MVQSYCSFCVHFFCVHFGLFVCGAFMYGFMDVNGRTTYPFFIIRDINYFCVCTKPVSLMIYILQVGRKLAFSWAYLSNVFPVFSDNDLKTIS